jgi:hypothetical protein
MGRSRGKVRELVTILQALPDQNAVVVMGEGSEHETWLAVSGVVQRWIMPIISDAKNRQLGSSRPPTGALNARKVGLRSKRRESYPTPPPPQ